LLVEKFQGTSATKYRIEMAEDLMQQGDVEPPHLYNANVLRVAKHETMQKNYIDKDPLKALHLMQLISSLQNVIHSIGLNPFFVHYWTNHQLHVHRTYTADETSCVNIDATGNHKKN